MLVATLTAAAATVAALPAAPVAAAPPRAAASCVYEVLVGAVGARARCDQGSYRVSIPCRVRSPATGPSVRVRSGWVGTNQWATARCPTGYYFQTGDLILVEFR